jgi:DNA-binding GntR family transcriptional regulator
MIPDFDGMGTAHDPGTAEEPPARPAPAAPIPQRPMQTIHAQSNLPPSRTRVAHVVTDVWTPTPDIAAALRQEDYSAPVVVRYRVVVDAITGHPLEIRTSYTPAAIAAGTPIAQAIELPGPWESIIHEATGHTPATATATTTARPPSQSEAQTLAIPEHGGIVLVRDTALYATRDTSGPALSLTRSVWPADATRVTLAYPVTVG